MLQLPSCSVPWHTAACLVTNLDRKTLFAVLIVHFILLPHSCMHDTIFHVAAAGGTEAGLGSGQGSSSRCGACRERRPAQLHASHALCRRPSRVRIPAGSAGLGVLLR